MSKAQSQVQKTKGERVKESVTLLKRLMEVGIHSEDLGYKATKQLLDTWISDGAPKTETIDFARYGRIGHLTLPEHSGNPPTFLLKATEELKEQLMGRN
jgi:hypothetical protein